MKAAFSDMKILYQSAVSNVDLKCLSWHEDAKEDQYFLTLMQNTQGIPEVGNVEISALSSPPCSSSSFLACCTIASWSTRGSMDRGGGGGHKGEGQH